MAKKKGWDSLSPGYRERLERKGLSKKDYEEATSLKKYRGHEHTPEKPDKYNRDKYKEYDNARQKLEQDLFKKKQEIFGDSPKWNARKAQKNITDKKVPIAQLRKAMAMTAEDWLEAIRDDPESWYFLGYH